MFFFLRIKISHYIHGDLVYSGCAVRGRGEYLSLYNAASIYRGDQTEQQCPATFIRYEAKRVDVKAQSSPLFTFKSSDESQGSTQLIEIVLACKSIQCKHLSQMFVRNIKCHVFSYLCLRHIRQERQLTDFLFTVAQFLEHCISMVRFHV